MEKMIGIIFNAKKASETFITQQTGKPTTIFLDNYEGSVAKFSKKSILV